MYYKLMFVLKGAGHFNAGEFVDIIYVNRMRTNGDKQFVVQLFEKVKYLYLTTYPLLII